MAEKYVSVTELRKLLGIPTDGQCTGCQFSTFHGCKDDSLRRVCEAIDDAPEADVRPVMRAHWEWDENGMDWNLGAWKCSHCHCKAETWWATDKHNPLYCAGSHFCGNCGADMREGRNDSYGGNHDRV